MARHGRCLEAFAQFHPHVFPETSTTRPSDRVTCLVLGDVFLDAGGEQAASSQPQAALFEIDFKAPGLSLIGQLSACPGDGDALFGAHCR